MYLSYEETKDIAYYMCDRTQRLTLPMLVNLLLDVSEKQSDSLERGEAYIRNRGLSWIILHYAFDISRMPRLNETVYIETFATEYNKLFTYRTFIVKDSNRTELIKVETTFALLDSEKRKMARIPEDIVAPYKAEYSKRIRRNTKPDEVNSEEYNEKQYAVRYFDIDGNNHVNNSHYINWILDSLDSTFLLDHDITRGVITFNKEVSENQLVFSQSSIREEEGLNSDHIIKSEDTVHCSATFTWENAKRRNMNGYDQ